MANEIKFKDGELVKLETQIKRKLEQTINNSSLLTQVGEYLVKNIKGEARLGKGYPTAEANTQEKLKPLQKATIKKREEIGKLNPNGPLFNPKKSNLTITGATLESISFIASNTKPLLTITAEGDHPGYAQKNGKRTKSVPFRDILRWQAEKGRNIFGISTRMYSSVVKMIKAHLRRELK